MTDKTIINGVDVSGCEFYNLPIQRKVANCYANCRACITKHAHCKNNPNCHFKQCARKDERIRELEQKLSQIAQEIKEYREDCSDYEGDDTDGYCYGCQDVYCLAKQIKQIAEGE